MSGKRKINLLTRLIVALGVFVVVAIQPLSYMGGTIGTQKAEALGNFNSDTQNAYIIITVQADPNVEGLTVTLTRQKPVSGHPNTYTLTKKETTNQVFDEHYEGYLFNTAWGGNRTDPKNGNKSGQCVSGSTLSDSVLQQNNFKITIKTDFQTTPLGSGNVQFDCSGHATFAAISVPIQQPSSGPTQSIHGKLQIVTSDSNQKKPFISTVTLYKDGSKTNQTTVPNPAGNYRFDNIDTGTYSLKGDYEYNGGGGNGIYHLCADGIKVDKGKDVTKDKDVNFKDSSVCGQTDTEKGDTTAAAAGSEDTCEGTAGPLGWIVCGIINLVRDTVKGIEDTIGNLLVTQTLTPNTPYTNSIYAAWAGVRGLADALLIVVFLIIIFGQTLSIDAYTIKKSLPRIVAAAILIQLSFFISSLMIDISNILGRGVNELLTAALGATHPWQLSGIIGAAGTSSLAVGLGVLISAAFSGAALMAAIAIIISLLGVFLTLAFRSIAIIFLIISAPLALLLWVLPNTEKFAKMWANNFIKILLMFPIMMAIFAISGFAYGLTADLATEMGKDPTKFSSGTVASTQFLAIMIMIAPLFAIPFVFKMGGQLMSFGAGLITGRASALGGKVTGAQWVKDRKNFNTQERQRKGATAAVESKNVFGRAKGRIDAAGVGGFLSATPLGTKNAKRLLEQRYQAGTKAAGDDFDSLINRSGIDNDHLVGEVDKATGNYIHGDLGKIALAKSGSTVKLSNGKSVQVDSAMKSRAVQHLASRGNTAALRDIKQKLDVDKSEQGRRIFDAGIQSSIPDLMKKAPDLIKGTEGAYGKFSPEQLAGFNPDSIDAMTAHITSLTDPTERAEAEANLDNAVEGLVDSPILAPTVSGTKAAVAIYDAGLALSRPYVTGPTSRIDSSGKIT